jgi:hypothetical protein
MFGRTWKGVKNTQLKELNIKVGSYYQEDGKRYICVKITPCRNDWGITSDTLSNVKFLRCLCP